MQKFLIEHVFHRNNETVSIFTTLISSMPFHPYHIDKRALPRNLVWIRFFLPPQIKCLSLLQRNFLFPPTLLLPFIKLSIYLKS